MKTFLFWVAFIFLVVVGLATVVGLFDSKIRKVGERTLTIGGMIKNNLTLGLLLFIMMIFTVPSTDTPNQAATSKQQNEAIPLVDTKVETQNLEATSSDLGAPELGPSPSPTPNPSPSPSLLPSPTPTPKPSIKPSPTPTPTPKPTPTPTPKPTTITSTPTPESASGGGSWTCNCSKTCPNMSSCAEAQYQLNVCGCSARDADHDGIACDADCQ